MDSTQDLLERALAAHQAGQVAEATRLYREVLRIDPRNALAWHQLGYWMFQRGHAREAIDYLVRAIRLEGAQSRFHNNLGECYRALGKLRDAEACYRRALELTPDYLTPRVNLSWILRAVGRHAEADDAAGDVFARPRATPEEHCECGVLFLALGRFAEGWAEHEWRLALPHRPPLKSTAPQWDGSPLAGRTLLVYAEQGSGDTFQFARYVPLLRAAGGKTVFVAPRALVPLLSASDLGDVVPSDEPWPAHDVQIATLSLPFAFRTTLESIPARVPYLQADAARVAHWRERLSAWPGLRVGIQWQGNAAYVFDPQRSLPLAEFTPLEDVDGIHLLSLQKFSGSEQLAAWPGRLPLVDLGAELDLGPAAFLDTAAVMQNLDLVVTSDTATAHLAGALGVPVWVALAATPDWRWMFEREDSPWYPTMRLFRQSTPGNWKTVFARMAAELSLLRARREV